jgi:hypothetical protein
LREFYFFFRKSKITKEKKKKKNEIVVAIIKMSAHMFAQRINNERNREQRDAAISRSLRQTAVASGQHRSDARVESKRLEKVLQQATAEAHAEAALHAETAARERAVRAARQEETLVDRWVVVGGEAPAPYGHASFSFMITMRGSRRLIGFAGGSVLPPHRVVYLGILDVSFLAPGVVFWGFFFVLFCFVLLGVALI